MQCSGSGQVGKQNGKYRFAPYEGPKLEGNRSVIPRGSKLYPKLLEDISHPPETLYAIGDLHALGDGLAVIGARKATPYGIECARKFAGIAAERGITIISGGALGCDGAAHEAALDHGGKTVVVFGGGCDFIYPARHFELFQRAIDAGGVVVSERNWDHPALPYCFRERNRIIAGLSRATLIVEAGLPSGTFSTADDALEAGREVLVVPGAITSKTSMGSNRLLFQGAMPIIDEETFEDVLFNVYGCLKTKDGARDDGISVGSDEDALLAALQAEPMRVSEMRKKIAVPTGSDELTWIIVRIAELERRGLICRYPDGRFGPTRV